MNDSPGRAADSASARHDFLPRWPGDGIAGLTAYMQRACAHGQRAIDDCELAAAQFLGMLRGDSYLRCLLGQTIEGDMFDPIAGQAVATFMARYEAR